MATDRNLLSVLERIERDRPTGGGRTCCLKTRDPARRPLAFYTLLFALWCMGVDGDAQDKGEEFLRQCAKLQEPGVKVADGSLREIDKYLSRLRRTPVGKRASDTGIRAFANAKAKADAVKSVENDKREWERKLKLFREGKGYPTPRLADRLPVGAIGQLSSIHVEQIAGSDSFRGTVGDTPVWVSGYPTKRLVDDTRLVGDQTTLFQVVGTKSYTTVLGASKTIFEIKPFDLALAKLALKDDEELLPVLTTWQTPR